MNELERLATWLGASIARDVFAAGDEIGSVATRRIAFMGGQYPDNEIAQGGLSEMALASHITTSILKHIRES